MRGRVGDSKILYLVGTWVDCEDAFAIGNSKTVVVITSIGLIEMDK